LLTSPFLSRFDTTPSILKRPLSEPVASDEPQAKRQKSDDGSVDSITDKYQRGDYLIIDELASDILSVVKAQVSELQSTDSNSDPTVNALAIANSAKFKEKTIELFRREMIYPQGPFDPHRKMAIDSREDLQSDSAGNLVLMVHGPAPQARYLFSSLQQKVLKKGTTEEEVRPLPRKVLPAGIILTHAAPMRPLERNFTLSELYGSSKVLPPLQPPKAPKSQLKGNVLGFYHPELTDKCKYRSNSYYSQRLSIGQYLDYSNASPSSKLKTKQRERAQSLAGRRPSPTELETSELEALFRGAFSSFAPCKDDSAAVVPSSLAGKVWWRKAGRHNFSKMIKSCLPSEDESSSEKQPDTSAPELQPLDLDSLEKDIKEFDESMVDPELQKYLGFTKDEGLDKEADELLEEVSELLETLASYQRIRNVTLPSQSRHANDPVNGDMLANSSGPAPSEAEIATYETLKAQLKMIVDTLPPYAVAKLNGDQLNELLVSTKLEVRTDQYRGNMEEDETAQQARMRQHSTTAGVAATPRPTPHRAPSGSSPYNQFANSYGTPTRTPVPVPQYYRPAQNAVPQQQPNTVPRPGVPHQGPMPVQRPPQNQAYRPANGYPAYAQQLAKTQTPYGHQNMPQYAGQARNQFPGYGGMPQHGTPNRGYHPGYQPGQAPQGMSPQTPYAGYTPNGASPMPQRAMPPQNMAQPHSPSPNPLQQHQHQHQHQQHQQRPMYGTPNQSMPGTPVSRQYSSGNVPQMQNNNAAQSPGLTGYHTVLPVSQQQRAIEQAQARFAAREKTLGFGDKIAQSGIAGLAGIGLTGSMDIAKMASANLAGGVQKHQMPAGGVGGGQQRPGVNGVGTPQQSHSPVPQRVTPVPVPVIPQVQRPPPQVPMQGLPMQGQSHMPPQSPSPSQPPPHQPPQVNPS
jgi:hypothetical protein